MKILIIIGIIFIIIGVTGGVTGYKQAIRKIENEGEMWELECQSSLRAGFDDDDTKWACARAYQIQEDLSQFGIYK